MKILFVCTGNSCRSQMAEAWANHLGAGLVDAYSAGVNPIGVVRPTVEIMAEAGVDISRQRSKAVDEFVGECRVKGHGTHQDMVKLSWMKRSTYTDIRRWRTDVPTKV